MFYLYQELCNILRGVKRKIKRKHKESFFFQNEERIGSRGPQAVQLRRSNSLRLLQNFLVSIGGESLEKELKARINRL